MKWVMLETISSICIILIQVQHKNAMYSGTFDAYKKISQTEGIRGLYRGFWISCFQVVSGIFYVSTYEGVRHILDKNGVQDPRVKAMLGGSCASMGECSDHQTPR